MIFGIYEGHEKRIGNVLQKHILWQKVEALHTPLGMIEHARFWGTLSQFLSEMEIMGIPHLTFNGTLCH